MWRKAPGLHQPRAQQAVRLRTENAKQKKRGGGHLHTQTLPPSPPEQINTKEWPDPYFLPGPKRESLFFAACARAQLSGGGPNGPLAHAPLPVAQRDTCHVSVTPQNVEPNPDPLDTAPPPLSYPVAELPRSCYRALDPSPEANPTAHARGPRGRSFCRSNPGWLQAKLWVGASVNGEQTPPRANAPNMPPL